MGSASFGEIQDATGRTSSFIRRDDTVLGEIRPLY